MRSGNRDVQCGNRGQKQVSCRSSAYTLESQDPIRDVWVAQVLIKVHTREPTGEAYLVRRDGDISSEYRLIGGRYEMEDGNLLETMKREMQEELGLKYQCDYTLQELIHELSVPVRISPTFGVLSRYHYRVYWARIHRQVMLRMPGARWVNKSELFAGRTESGEKVAAWHIQAIDRQLPGGLEQLASSYPEQAVQDVTG